MWSIVRTPPRLSPFTIISLNVRPFFFLAFIEADGSKSISGCWDSVHVLDVIDEVNDKGRISTTTYKLTSTIMLWMETEKDNTGTMDLSGNMTRQVLPYF